MFDHPPREDFMLFCLAMDHMHNKYFIGNELMKDSIDPVRSCSLL
jgi:hypothetical protein